MSKLHSIGDESMTLDDGRFLREVELQGRRRFLLSSLTLPLASPRILFAEEKEASPFLKLPNVKVTATETHWIVESDGIPNHPTAKYPNRDNPNSIRKQNYKFYIPRKPTKAATPTRTPMGPIGVAINGIPIYNQFNAEGEDAVKVEVFDSCCGHPDPGGRYHYHKFPVCVKSPFKRDESGHSPLFGFAFDGFAIYGPEETKGKPPTDLDECNGHEDAIRGYHYHATKDEPYLIGKYRGTPDPRNLERGGPGKGKGGPGKGKGPPPGKRPPGGRPFPPSKV
jgi:hypothetical protein